jgi:hypothetical protein
MQIIPPQDDFQTVVAHWLRKLGLGQIILNPLLLIGLLLGVFGVPTASSGRLILPFSTAILLGNLSAGVYLVYSAWPQSALAAKTAALLARPWAAVSLRIFSFQVTLAGLACMAWLKIYWPTPIFERAEPLLVWLIMSAAGFWSSLEKPIRQLKPVGKTRLTGGRIALLGTTGLAIIYLGLSATSLFLVPAVDGWARLVVQAAAVALAFDVVWLIAIVLPNQPPATLRIPEWLKSALQFADAHRAWAALAAAIVYFTLFFLLIQSGYGANDDVEMAGLVSGYFGSGQPSMFLIHSNLAWGWLAQNLFRWQPVVNWLIVLYWVTHFLAIWALLWMMLNWRILAGAKVFGWVVVLLFELYFATNITFTTTAAMAALAGSGLLLTGWANRPQADQLSGGARFLGGLLIVLSSLIRLNTLLMAVALLTPAVAVYFRQFRLRQALLSLGILTVLTLGGYVLDRAIWNSYPNWADFERYFQTRVQLTDTPRIANATPQDVQSVGWSANDLYMYSEWFYPDPQTYSLEKLKTLNTSLPGRRIGLVNNLAFLFNRFLDPIALPFGLLTVAVWLALLLNGASQRAILASSLSVAALIGLSLYLGWTIKLPLRVFLPMLAGTALALLLIRAWDPPDPAAALPRGVLIFHIGVAGLLATFLLCAGIILTRTAITSALNRDRQTGYARILTDLNRLQLDGTLPSPVLIVAPDLGIPLEWAKPLWINFPKQRYLTMGWLNFSPAYQEVLGQMNVTVLPQGFYEGQNVLLMTRPGLITGIRDFIQEHNGVSVTAIPLYKLPAALEAPEYQSMQLYRLRRK